MKALSLTRPWTWLVLHGGKTTENRVWQTSYRGPVVVHGALSQDVRAVIPFLDLLRDPAAGAFEDALTDGRAMATGLLGVVDLVGCCTTEMTGDGVCSCGPWAMPGQAHWQLANPRPFRVPIPAKGALGLWRLTRDQQDEIDLRLKNMETTHA